jgi:parallel beta-helix repeat protein
MTFWNGNEWIDESKLHAGARRNGAPRGPMARLGDRIATVGMVLGLAALLIPFASAQAGSPSLTLSPTSGAPGSTVRVVGTAFPSRIRVQLEWAGVATGLPSVQVNGNGSFKATITVPNAASDAYLVSAVQVASKGKTSLKVPLLIAEATFTVSGVDANPAPSSSSTPSPAGATPTPVTTPGVTPAPDPTAPVDANPTPAPVTTPPPSPTPTPDATPSPTPTVTPTPATTSVFYVATTGSDTASGTSIAPWRTVGHAVAFAPAGSTIRIESGTYAPFSITRPSLTLENVTGAAVTISGGTTAIAITASDTTIRGLRVTGATGQGIWADGADNLVLSGLQVDHNIGHGIQVIRSSTIQIVNSTVSSNELSGVRELDGTTGGRYTGNTIADNGHDGQSYNGDGLLLQGSGAYVANNLILRNGDSNIYEHGIYAASVATGYVITNNTVRDNSASGIKASGSGSVTNNTISGSVRGIVFADDGGTVRVSGNTIAATMYAIDVTSNCVLSRYVSDYNVFVTETFGLGGAVNLATWRLTTGLDLHSS